MQLEPDRLADIVIRAIEIAVDPMLERIAVAEARLEMKAAEMVPVLAALTDLTKENATLRERIAVLEARPSAVPAGHWSSPAPSTDHDFPGIVTDLTKELGAVRERIAVVEVRAQVPGPAGKDGRNGKDGADGIGFDELFVVQENDRTVIVRGSCGARVKDLGMVTFPVEIYRGVWVEKAYERGDGVTWAGSEWHCNEPTTTKPGDGSKAWTLKVKRGRDGKDGAEGAPGRPGRDLTPEGRR